MKLDESGKLAVVRNIELRTPARLELPALCHILNHNRQSTTIPHNPIYVQARNPWVPFPATASFSLSFFTYGIKHVSINQGKVRIDASVCLLQSSSKHSTHVGYPACLCSLFAVFWYSTIVVCLPQFLSVILSVTQLYICFSGL